MVNNTKRLSIMGTRRMNDFKKNINTIMNKNGARESVFYQEDPIVSKKKNKSINTNGEHSDIPHQCKYIIFPFLAS